MTAATLRRLDDEDLIAAGGTVVYAVLVDDRRIGWVGDSREWRGHRFGGREWWACWREDGDTAARWNSFSNDSAHKTRAAAVADLFAHVAAGSREGADR